MKATHKAAATAALALSISATLSHAAPTDDDCILMGRYAKVVVTSVQMGMPLSDVIHPLSYSEVGVRMRSVADFVYSTGVSGSEANNVVYSKCVAGEFN